MGQPGTFDFPPWDSWLRSSWSSAPESHQRTPWQRLREMFLETSKPSLPHLPKFSRVLIFDKTAYPKRLKKQETDELSTRLEACESAGLCRRVSCDVLWWWLCTMYWLWSIVSSSRIFVSPDCSIFSIWNSMSFAIWDKTEGMSSALVMSYLLLLMRCFVKSSVACSLKTPIISTMIFIPLFSFKICSIRFSCSIRSSNAWMPLKSILVLEMELAWFLKALVSSTMFNAVGCLTPGKFLVLVYVKPFITLCLSYVLQCLMRLVVYLLQVSCSCLCQSIYHYLSFLCYIVCNSLFVWLS